MGVSSRSVGSGVHDGVIQNAVRKLNAQIHAPHNAAKSSDAINLHRNGQHSHFAPKWKTHTLKSTGTRFRGINSLHHVINPTLPPTDRKDVKVSGRKKKKSQCSYHCVHLFIVFISPLPVSAFFVLVLFTFLLFSLSCTFLLSVHQFIFSCSLSQPVLINRGS